MNQLQGCEKDLRQDEHNVPISSDEHQTGTEDCEVPRNARLRFLILMCGGIECQRNCNRDLLS